MSLIYFKSNLSKSPLHSANFGKNQKQITTRLTQETLNQRDALAAYRIYFILGALFICSLVVSNLIFQKFFYWDFFGLYRFEISVGILPYPITFLITDLISEIYGQKKANQVVTAGIFASVFFMLMSPTWNMMSVISVWIRKN